MIKWYKNLYTDELAKKKEEKLKKTLEKGKVSIGVYVISLATNRDNLFDIIGANELLFRHYKNNDIYVVGLAYGKENAIMVVQNIIEEIYQNTNNFNVRDYFNFD